MRTPSRHHPDTRSAALGAHHAPAPLRFWIGCALFAAGALIGGGESLRWLGRLA